MRDRAEYRGRSVYVFVHGFQGNSYDMRMFKNQLALLCPDALCLLSTSNELLTEGDIREMGARLAAEVHNFIRENCADIPLGRLSFICHSLGSIITRTALAHDLMRPHLDKCFNFVSLASPHCGYMLGENGMVSVGMW